MLFGRGRLGSGRLCFDGAGWFLVTNPVSPDRRDVELLGVLEDHPARGEMGSGDPDRVAHPVDPPERDALRVAVVEEGDDLLFEEPVEVLRVDLVLFESFATLA